MARRIHLALVWHMHQPYYKDDLTDTFLLPWVRLHCAKDYVKMPALLDQYPRVRQTFNLVPSLLAQIEDYSGGTSGDLFLNLCRRPAADLSGEEKDFLVRWVRESPRALRVQASQRYLELAGRRPEDEFTVDDLRDIQVWSNLAWFDPLHLDSDPALSELKARDRGFTEADKEIVFAAQHDLVRQVIPRYRELEARGQAELTTSPFYHPILPLVCHVDSARTAQPEIRLPERRFSHREDAEQQLRLGISQFERLFGHPPRGMWPPEMAVGESVAGLAVQAGLDWIISDEDVLARSLERGVRYGDQVTDPGALYRPFRLEREGRSLAVVFRDSLLSNLMGFDYYHRPALDAARDFIDRVHAIGDMQGDGPDLLVVVALDGENAWEFYPRDGHDFLNALYSSLQADERIECTTVSDFLSSHPAEQTLPRLHTGSWIGATLDTWIGDPEHNVAWDLLGETRDWLEATARTLSGREEQIAAAWREILITEGSDWYWWFSHKHDSGMDAIWDNQYRLHLRNVYNLLDNRAPARLYEPIIQRAGEQMQRRPTGQITPHGPDDPAWELAGRYEASSGFGALHRPAGLIQRVLYGLNDESLHLRFDFSRPRPDLAENGIEIWTWLSGTPPGPEEHDESLTALPIGPPSDLGFDPAFAVRVRVGADHSQVEVLRVHGDRVVGTPRHGFDVGGPVAFSIPFASLRRTGGQPVEMGVSVVRADRELERLPPSGSLGIRVPSSRLAEAVGGDPLSVLLVSTEFAPLAKTGGPADVVAAIAKEMRRLGHDARVILPRFRHLDAAALGFEVAAELAAPLGSQSVPFTLWRGNVGEVPVMLVDCPRFFDRDAPYGFGDDDARFILFSQAVVETMRSEFTPDVVNIHDWHAALVPNLLHHLRGDDERLQSVASALTIHNLGFQGVFGYGALHLAGLEEAGLMRMGVAHLDDVVNLLARGIHFSDVVNTVSERYADAIQSPEFGEGLDALLRNQGHKVYGIVNGIDYDLFDPARDPNLPSHYSAEDPRPKTQSKAALRHELGLAETDVPVLALVSRLYDQKGLDIFLQALPGILKFGVQVVVLGTGERRYEDRLREMAAQQPQSLAVVPGFDHRVAQLIYAGSDMLLMASRMEPCGLGQLIALRYGTVPVVHAAGGLVDTVPDYDAGSGGVGFGFSAYDSWQLFAAVVRAAEVYRHHDQWRALVQRAMRTDVSWTQSALRYVQLYRAAVVGHRERLGNVAVAR